jgi:TolA-binding protein
MVLTIQEATRKIEQLEDNQKKQNQYITKLEQQNKDLQGAIQEASQQMDHVDIRGYVLESRAKDFRREAEQNIKRLYGEKVFQAILPDWEEWLGEFLIAEQASIPFFEQSFQMAYGKALGNPEHPVHKPADDTVATTDVAASREEHLDRENSRVIDASLLPETLSDSDGGTLIPEESVGIGEVANTEEALKNFRLKMANLGKNPFEE